MRRRRILFTLTILVLLTFTAAGCGKQLPPQPKGEVPEYSIIKCEDTSLKDTKMYTLAIEVPGQPDTDDLKKVAQQAAHELAKEKDFNALSIWFYDYKEYYGYSICPLGEVTYAPDGSISNAKNIQPGEYDKMSFNYENLKEKDWSKQLTAEEVKVWKKYRDKMEQVGAEKALELVSKETGKSPQEIQQIYSKQSAW